MPRKKGSVIIPNRYRFIYNCTMQTTKIEISELKAPFDLTQLREVLLRLDTTFTTDMVYEVECQSNSFKLVLRVLETPLIKKYELDLDSDEKEWDRILLAKSGNDLCGYLAYSYNNWNKRLCIWHFYVAPEHRKKGVGTILVDHLKRTGQIIGAKNVWVETNNLNYPAIQMYQKMGFNLCGIDTSLYAGTEGECSEEVAVFLSSPL